MTPSPYKFTLRNDIVVWTGITIPIEANVVVAIFVVPLNSALNPFLYTVNVLRDRLAEKQEKRLQQKVEKQVAVDYIKQWRDERLLLSVDLSNFHIWLFISTLEKMTQINWYFSSKSVHLIGLFQPTSLLDRIVQFFFLKKICNQKLEKTVFVSLFSIIQR